MSINLNQSGSVPNESFCRPFKQGKDLPKLTEIGTVQRNHGLSLATNYPRIRIIPDLSSVSSRPITASNNFNQNIA